MSELLHLLSQDGYPENTVPDFEELTAKAVVLMVQPLCNPCEFYWLKMTLKLPVS